MIKKRPFLDIPQALSHLKPNHLSRGECLHCNESCDVLNIPSGDGNIPILLHSGEACEKMLKQSSKPNATPCADQRFGLRSSG